MNVYFVVEAPVTVSQDNVFFTSLDINNAAAFLTEHEAKDHGTELVQAHRGKVHWIVKGSPIYAMECPPAPVVISPMVVAPSNGQLAALVDNCGHA